MRTMFTPPGDDPDEVKRQLRISIMQHRTTFYFASYMRDCENSPELWTENPDGNSA